MEGRGGHTKECKVRTTTSANPLLATACPHSAPHPSWQPPPPPPSPPPIASSSFFTVSSSSAGGYNALSYKAVLSSPSLNCFPTPPVLRFLSPPPPIPNPDPPGERVVSPFALDPAEALVADPRVVTRQAPNSTPSSAIIRHGVSTSKARNTLLEHDCEEQSVTTGGNLS